MRRYDMVDRAGRPTWHCVPNASATAKGKADHFSDGGDGNDTKDHEYQWRPCDIGRGARTNSDA